MGNETQAPSELMAAATLFDEELGKFARLAENVCQETLDSQVNLQRAARAFQEIGDAEKRLGVAAQELVGALNTARKVQQTHTETIQARAQEIAQRTAVAAELLKRYGAIGQKAAELNALVLDLAGKKNGNSNTSHAELLPVLGQVRARMAEVIEGARELALASRKANFEDIAREADSLHEQVAGADAKIASIERTLSPR
jgi:hypothetical protein